MVVPHAVVMFWVAVVAAVADVAVLASLAAPVDRSRQAEASARHDPASAAEVADPTVDKSHWRPMAATSS